MKEGKNMDKEDDLPPLLPLLEPIIPAGHTVGHTHQVSFFSINFFVGVAADFYVFIVFIFRR